MNSLLSEFKSAPKLRTFLENKWAGLWLGTLFFFGALAATILARKTGADCLIRKFSVLGGGNLTMVAGYCGELNHALFHTLCIPGIAYLSFFFLSRANTAIDELSSGGIRPSLSREIGSVPDLVALWNLRVFRWFSPFCLLLALFIVWKNEAKTYNAQNFGWVQASYYPTWTNSVGNKGTNIIFGVPQEAARKLGTNNSVAEVRLDGITRCHEPQLDPKRWHKIFLIFALGHQVASYTFGIWIAGKIIFLLVVLSVGMRSVADIDKKGHPIQVNLHFYDGEYRFGFKTLDYVYDAAAGVLTMAAVGVLLQFHNNAKEPGEYFDGVMFLGRLISLIVPGLVFLTIVALPIIVFGTYAASARSRECIALREKLGRAQSAEEQKKIIDDLNLVGKQRAWPAGDKIFWGLIVVSVVLMVGIPTGLALPGSDKYSAFVQSVFQQLPQLFCDCQ